MFNIKKILNGIGLLPKTTLDSDTKGELQVSDSDNKLHYHNGTTRSPVVTETHTSTLQNKTIDSANNTITVDADEATVQNLEVDNLKSGVLNTSTAMTGASDTQVPSALAIKTYVDNSVASKDEASEISYSNATSGLSATNVQTAVDEVEARLDTAETNISNNASDLSDHLADAVDAHDASAISVVPTGNLASTDAQSALVELQGDINTNTTAIGNNATAISNHLADAVDAHDASAISVAPTGNLTATDAQSALAELQSDIDTRATSADLNAHLTDTVDAHDASAISSVASGNLAATDVQSALNELQTDIDTRATSTDLSNHTSASTNVHGLTGGAAVVGTTSTQTLTNKTIQGASIQSPTKLEAKLDTFANLTTYASGSTNGQFCFATDTKVMYQVIDGVLTEFGGGGGTSFQVTQASHGFAVLDAVYHNGTSYAKAQADDANTLAQYIVIEVVDANNFKAANFQRFTATAHGKTVGEFYFLSESVPGGSSTTEGSVYSCPLFYVEDANTIHALVYRPSIKPQITQFREDVDLLSNILDFDTTSAGFSLENTVNGETFRLTHDASVTRYAEKDLTVTPKFQDKVLQLNVDLKSTASSGNFKVIVTDLTNSVTLADEVLAPQTDSATIKRTVSFSTKPAEGDLAITSIRVRFEALAEGSSPTSDFDDITVGLLKTQVREIIAIEQEENVFSARIANNGTATITSQSSPFIDSVSRPGTGAVQINFKPGFFTVAPSVVASVRSPSNLYITIENTPTTSLTSVQVRNDAGTAVDADVMITVQRQGSDYRDLTRRVEREISTFKEVIVEEADSTIRVTDGTLGNGAVATYVRRFKTLLENRGDAITFVDDADDGSKFVINKSGIYNISYSLRNNGSGYNVGVVKNPSTLTSDLTAMNASEILNMTSVSGTLAYQGSGATAYLQEGDEIRVIAPPAFEDTIYDWFNITYQGSLKKATVAPDSKIEIPTSEIYMDGATAIGTGTEAGNVKFTAISQIRGDGLTVDNSNATIINVNKDGLLTIHAALYQTATATRDILISKNTANPASDPLVSERIADGHTASGNAGGATASVYVKAGDKIRVRLNGGTTPVGTFNFLRVTHQEQKIQVAVSNVTPQYEDVDSMVRLQGGNGAGSTNTAIRRFSNVLENLGSDITYTDSATEGAKFVINEDGNYEISYSEQHSGAAAVYFGITKNSTELTTGINALATPSSRLSIQTATGTSGLDFQSTSWSGYLSAGDVIRPHVGNTGAPNGVLIPTFTIAKVGVPSIAEVDVTPFADVNRVERQFVRFDGHAGYGSTATRIPYFSFNRQLEGSNLVTVSNSTVNGLSFTALKDCTITASYTSAGSTLARFGWSLNAASLTTELTSLNAEQRLSVSTGDSANVEDTSTITIKLKEGDVLRPHCDNYAAAVTSRHHITLTAEADSRTTMYSVAQIENEFSARISNNGTAAIVSESSPFIDSVTRTGLGLVQINFKSGFFTEIPSIQVTDDSVATQMSTSSIGNVTINSVTIETYNEGAAAYQDRDFAIHVSRQGADRQDLQKAIVQLNEFPRVNKVISQHISHSSAGSTLLDRNLEVRFTTTNLSSNGSSILAIEDDSGNSRTKFVALKKCRVHVEFNAVLDGLATLADIRKNGTRITYGSQTPGVTYYSHVAASITLEKGDYITLGSDSTNVANTANPVYLNILAEAEDLEVVTNVDAHENVFSARIAAGATLTSESYPFIQSVSSGGTGIVTVTFKPNFFSVIPSIQATSENGTGRIVALDGAPTTSSVTFRTTTENGTLENANFTFTAKRQGDDYKAIQDVVAQVFTPKVAYVKDIAASGTNRASTATTWNQRVLNTVEGDSEIVSLSANRFTLQSGKYKIKSRGHVVQTNQAHSRLVKDPAGTPVYYYGEPIFSGIGDSVGSFVQTEHLIEISIPTTFEIQNYTALGGANKLGADAGLGVDQVFATVEITKIY